MWLPSIGKGLLTALVVMLVLVLQRRAAVRAGGMLAAVPATSTPALVWLCIDHGPAYAGAAAMAALLATGLTGLFSVLYARASLRAGPWPGLLASAVPCIGLASLLPAWAGGDTLLAGALCAGLLLSSTVAMPVVPSKWSDQSNRPLDTVLTIAASAVVTTLIGVAAPHLSPDLCGMLTATPVIAMSTVVALHRRQGPNGVVLLLRGYVRGLWAKAAFLGALAALLLSWTPWLAWLASVGVGAAAAAALLSPSPRGRCEPVPIAPLPIAHLPIAHLPIDPSPKHL